MAIIPIINGSIFIATCIIIVGPNFGYQLIPFDKTSLFMMIINMIVTIVMIDSNIYKLYKLYRSYSTKNPQESTELPIAMKIAKSFTFIIAIFIVCWIIVCINIYTQLLFAWYRLGHNTNDVSMFAIDIAIAIIGAFGVSVIHLECANIKSFVIAKYELCITDTVSMIGTFPAILFQMKCYVLIMIGGSCYIIFIYQNSPHYCTWWEVTDWWEDYHSTDCHSLWYSMIATHSVISVLGIILWFKCQSHTKHLLLYHNSTQIVSQNNKENIVNFNETPVLMKRNCFYKLYVSFNLFWKKHKFWNQNIVIVISCIISISGMLYQYIKAKKQYDNRQILPNYCQPPDCYDCDYWWTVCVTNTSIIDEFNESKTQLMEIGVACGSIAFISISSMIIHKYPHNYCTKTIASDNKFRFLCFAKTALLLIKQILISQTSSNIWKWTFRILSVVTLITISIFTYAFDKQFLNEIVSKMKMKHPKTFYISYGISYFVSIISASIIVVSSLHSFGNDLILYPFIYLFATKLYNNEYARYKEDIKRKMEGVIDTKQFATTIKSLYCFQCAVVMMSFSTIVAFIAFKRIYGVIAIIQMVLAAIICVNGIVTLYILNDHDDDAKYYKTTANLSIALN